MSLLSKAAGMDPMIAALRARDRRAFRYALNAFLTRWGGKDLAAVAEELLGPWGVSGRNA